MIFLFCVMALNGISLEKVAPVDWQGNPATLMSRTISPNGHIYFIDPMQGMVFHTDLQGNSFPTIGKRGEGPGEFNWAEVVLFDKPHLYVYDSAKERLYQIDPKTRTFLKSWKLPGIEALSIQGTHMAGSFRIPRKSNIFVMGTIGNSEIKFQHFIGGIPTSLKVSGAKISTVLHASDGTLWMAYSGAFELQQFTRQAKRLQFITDPPRDYVVPSQSDKISRFNTKAMSENVRKFDKMKSLYEVGNHIVLYRPKVLNNSYLDIFTKEGKRIASLKSDSLHPIGVLNGELYAFLVSDGDNPWDLMIVKFHF